MNSDLEQLIGETKKLQKASKRGQSKKRKSSMIRRESFKAGEAEANLPVKAVAALSSASVLSSTNKAKKSSANEF